MPSPWRSDGWHGGWPDMVSHKRFSACDGMSSAYAFVPNLIALFHQLRRGAVVTRATVSVMNGLMECRHIDARLTGSTCDLNASRRFPGHGKTGALYTPEIAPDVATQLRRRRHALCRLNPVWAGANACQGYARLNRPSQGRP